MASFKWSMLFQTCYLTLSRYNHRISMKRHLHTLARWQDFFNYLYLLLPDFTQKTTFSSYPSLPLSWHTNTGSYHVPVLREGLDITQFCIFCGYPVSFCEPGFCEYDKETCADRRAWSVLMGLVWILQRLSISEYVLQSISQTYQLTLQRDYYSHGNMWTWVK